MMKVLTKEQLESISLRLLEDDVHLIFRTRNLEAAHQFFDFLKDQLLEGQFSFEVPLPDEEREVDMGAVQ